VIIYATNKTTSRFLATVLHFIFAHRCANGPKKSVGLLMEKASLRSASVVFLRTFSWAASQTLLPEQTKGMGMLPKLAVDVMECEVDRLIQLCSKQLLPVKIEVPRKVCRASSLMKSYTNYAESMEVLPTSGSPFSFNQLFAVTPDWFYSDFPSCLVPTLAAMFHASSQKWVLFPVRSAEVWTFW